MRSTKWYGAFAVMADAPIIVLMVIAAFTFGDRIPGIGERLADRKEMWLSQWNNDVYGGDHLAHSYWTLSSGGFSRTRHRPRICQHHARRAYRYDFAEHRRGTGLAGIDSRVSTFRHTYPSQFLTRAQVGAALCILPLQRHRDCYGRAITPDCWWLYWVAAAHRCGCSFLVMGKSL